MEACGPWRRAGRRVCGLSGVRAVGCVGCRVWAVAGVALGARPPGSAWWVGCFTGLWGVLVCSVCCITLFCRRGEPTEFQGLRGVRMGVVSHPYSIIVSMMVKHIPRCVSMFQIPAMSHPCYKVIS